MNEGNLAEQIIGTMLGGGLILSIASWFINRYVKQVDDRMKKIEDRQEHIQVNYNTKFEKVYEKLDRNDRNLIRKVDEIQKDKHEHRIAQAKQLGIIESKLENLNNRKP